MYVRKQTRSVSKYWRDFGWYAIKFHDSWGENGGPTLVAAGQRLNFSATCPVIISKIQTGDFKKIKYHKPSILEYNRYHSLNL